MEEIDDRQSHAKSDVVEASNNVNDAQEADKVRHSFDLLDLDGPFESVAEPQSHSNGDTTHFDFLSEANPPDTEIPTLQDNGGPFGFALPHSTDNLPGPPSLLDVETHDHDLLGTQDAEQANAGKMGAMKTSEAEKSNQPFVHEANANDPADSKGPLIPSVETSSTPLDREEHDEGSPAESQSSVALHGKADMHADMQVASSVPINNSVMNNDNVEETSSNDTVANAVMRVEQLQRELSDATALIELLKSQQNDALVQELQIKLQEQMSLKAEAENQARLCTKEINDLKGMYDKMAAEIQDFQEIRANVEKQMSAKAEVENEARIAKKRAAVLESERDELLQRLNELESSRDQESSAASEAESTAKLAFDRIEQLEKDLNDRDGRVEALEEQLTQACQEVESQRHELHKLREEREELLRKEVSLTSRLNAAKMKESDKSNLAEQYESEIKAVEDELKSTKSALVEMTTSKQKLEQQLEALKASSNERVNHAEHALAEERRLNEERKKKMKVFVENKAEELRQAKEENDALQLEVNQANSSLLELNNRWKQVQAQYVQSQSRNRELQMDLNRIKKDSENLHRVGDTLEMKLSKSATETEEHKNKRLAAKHELMTVLRSLENEKKQTARLRDTIKFTFTPKALSQQKLLQENLDDFESQLQKLGQRLGKPIPPSTASGLDSSETESANDNDTSSDTDIERLIAKLERETQAVSQCIMELSGNLERMNVVLDSNADRTCVSVIAELLLTGGNVTSPAALQPGGNIIGGQARLGSRHRYGSVPSSNANN
jgi:chromosome segregation ATPase